MGIQTKIRDEIRKETVTKIHGQPTIQDQSILEKDIIAILATIPTALGGGNYGHIGSWTQQSTVPYPEESTLLTH